MSVDFPTHGVLLQVFDDFIEECGGVMKLRGCSTHEVCQHFILPLTSRKKLSYCELLVSEQLETSRVGPATHFISHAWQYDFLDVVDSLKEHFGAQENVYVWFDLFSNNQHNAPSRDHKWWSTVFASSIERIGHTVVILSPWDDPIPLKRSWCLYEIFCTIQSKKQLNIVMTKRQEDLFIKALMADPEAIDKMIGTVNVKRSQAMNPSDQDLIMKAVESTVGFDVLNRDIFTQLRHWLIDTAKMSLAQVEQTLKSLPDEPSNTSSRAQLLSHQAMLRQIVAFVHWRLCLYEQAVLEYKECLQLLIHLEHKEVLNWKEAIIKALRDIGLLYRDMNNYDDAKKCLENAVQRCEDDYATVLRGSVSSTSSSGRGSLVNKVRGLSNVMSLADKINILHQLGSTLRRNKDYALAEKYYIRCVQLFAALKGEHDENTLVAKANLGTMLSEHGKDVEAKHWFDQCLEALKNSPSERAMKHITPTTGRDWKQQLQSLLPIYESCYNERLKALGAEHPSTLLAMLQLAVLYRKDHQIEDAKKLLQSCTQIATVKLGDDDMPIVTKARVELAVLVLESKQSSEEEILISIKSLESAVLKMRKSLGDSDQDVRYIMERIVKEYLTLGALQFAEQQCLEYEQLVEKTFGKDSSKTIAAKRLLLEVYTKQRDKYWGLQEELANELKNIKEFAHKRLSIDASQANLNHAVAEAAKNENSAQQATEESKNRDVSLSKLKLIELLNEWKSKYRISNSTCEKAIQELTVDGHDLITCLESRPDVESNKFHQWKQSFEEILYPDYLHVKAGGFMWLVDKRYNIKKTVGSGAHGTVARAADEKTGVDVAIKAIRYIQRDKDNLIHCLREIKILKHVSGEIGFLKLCDAWVDPPEDRDFDSLYFAVNWMSIDMHKLIQSEQKLLDRHIQHFIFSILLAVKYLHLTGIIHRDLKPENILVSSQCDVAIADFSLSRGFRRAANEEESNEMVPLTEQVVTLWYRAPEVIVGSNSYDEKVDLWSVGCILAELHLRQPLFAGRDTVEQLAMIFSKIQLSPESAQFYAKIPAERMDAWQDAARSTAMTSELFPSMPPNAFDLLTQLLSLDPHKRPSAGEALQHPYFSDIYNQYSADELLEAGHVTSQFDFTYEKDLRSKSMKEILKLLEEEVSYFRHFV